MLINKKNLEIVSHCAAESERGYLTQGLQFTGNGTVATNGYYSIAISALEKNPDIRNHSVVSQADAQTLLLLAGENNKIEVEMLPNLVRSLGVEMETLKDGKIPWLDGWKDGLPVSQQIDIDVNYLLALVQAAITFGGKMLRIRFAPNSTEPIRLDTINTETKQKFYGLLMPLGPGANDKAFGTIEHPVVTAPPAPVVPAPPAPVEEDEFAKAMRLAAEM